MKKTISVLLVSLALLAQGCSTINGVGRDTAWIGQKVAEYSQTGASKQRDYGIAYSIKEQNRIIREGSTMYSALSSK